MHALSLSANTIFRQIPHQFRRTIMAQSGSNSAKKLIKIDISSDTVCPWCLVGKKNLEKAIDSVKDKYDFELNWHPFFLHPDASKEGIDKKGHYMRMFGPARYEAMTARMTEIFRGLGLDYSMTGLTGDSFDSHRLIYFAGKQGAEKQHAVVEEIMLGYFTKGKFVGDREFLLECAQKAGVEGAAEFLDNPENGKKEVNADLRQYSSHISGVPHFVINGKTEMSGGQPPEAFLSIFQKVAGQK